MGIIRVALSLCLLCALLRGSLATNATKCFACIHVELPTGVTSIYKNPYCEEYQMLTTINYAGEHCPNDGRDYVCAKIDGYLTFDIPSTGISAVKTVIRRCVVRPRGFQRTRQADCFNTHELDESTNDIDLIGTGIDEVGDVTKFTGEVCYCNGDNCNSASAVGHRALLVAFLTGVLATLVIRHF